MIGKLQGVVDYIGDGFVILMAGPVGYKVFTPDTLSPRETVALWIETVVREDSIRLFGFKTLAAQNLFVQLTGVSGVGPKGALSILNTLPTDTLMSAIATGDAKTITAAPGVGKKVAEKIIIELKSKVANSAFDSTTNDGGASGSALPDLLAALESLGYRRLDIVEMAQKLVAENPGLDVAKLVPLALKEISGNK